MTTRAPFGIILNDRRVEFTMIVDENSPADYNTQAAIQADKCCEPEVAHLMARVLRDGDHAVDAGANVGFFALLMGRLVGLAGAVIAIEPTPSTFTKLRENVRLNRMNQIRCVQAALWEKRENVVLHQSADSGQNSLMRAPHSVGKLSLVAATFDEIVQNSKIRLVKLDIEGAEPNAVHGAKQLNPANVPYVVSEVNDVALTRFGHTIADYRCQMASRGYVPFILHRDDSLPTLVPRGTKMAPGVFQNANVLFSTIEHVAAAWPEIRL